MWKKKFGSHLLSPVPGTLKCICHFILTTLKMSTLTRVRDKTQSQKPQVVSNSKALKLGGSSPDGKVASDGGEGSRSGCGECSKR